MSLIDEALKRAELEAARRDGLRGGAYPWVLESQPKRRRRWVAAAVIGLTVAVLAGGVVWLSRRPAAVPVPAGSKTENPKPKIEMETVEVAPPPKAPPVRAPAAGKAELEAKPAGPSGSPAASAEAGRAKGAAPRPASPAEGRAGGSAPAGKPAVRGLANGKTFFGEVELPEGGKIALEGIVWSETNPVALINGKVLPPGGVVEEFTIAAIQSDRVELNGRGMTIFLALK